MKRSQWVILVLTILSIVWLFAVVFNYYIVHKPLTIGNLAAIFNVLGDLLTAFLFYVLGAVLGRRLTRAMQFGSPLESLVMQTGLGLGIVSFITFGLGLVGFLNSVLFWSLLLLALFFLRRDLGTVLSDVCAVRILLPTRFDQVLGWFCLVSLLLAVIIALTPPIAWDAQTYHLVIPKMDIARGVIAAPPDIPYFSFPSLVEMVYLAAMLLKGDIVPQLIHLGYLGLVLLGVYALAERYLNARIGIMACAILIAVPSIVMVASWAYVDLALAFYAFIAFFAWLNARQTTEWRWYVLTGMFAGMAAGVKYTALIVPVALFGLILLTKESRRLKFAFAFLLSSGLVALPWYVRNLIFTGNPVYPFFLGGNYWDAFRAEWFGRFGTGLSNTPLQILTAPWDATILGMEGTVSYGATIGPLLLILIPLIVLPTIGQSRQLHHLIRDAAIFSGILYVFWLMGIAGSKLLLQTRLLFPAFPMFALIAAIAFDRLEVMRLPQFSLQRFMRLVILLVLGLTLIEYVTSFTSDNWLSYLTGNETRAAFLARHLGAYNTTTKFVNEKLPADARVLFLWEPRGYYVMRAMQPDTLLDTWAHLRWKYHDADAIAASLRASGYTHLVLNRQGLNSIWTSHYDPISDVDVQTLQTMLGTYARVIDGIPLETSGNQIDRAESVPYTVYELNR
jgi:hypothetical protein